MNAKCSASTLRQHAACHSFRHIQTLVCHANCPITGRKMHDCHAKLQQQLTRRSVCASVCGLCVSMCICVCVRVSVFVCISANCISCIGAQAAPAHTGTCQVGPRGKGPESWEGRDGQNRMGSPDPLEAPCSSCFSNSHLESTSQDSLLFATTWFRLCHLCPKSQKSNSVRLDLWGVQPVRIDLPIRCATRKTAAWDETGIWSAKGNMTHQNTPDVSRKSLANPSFLKRTRKTPRGSKQS